jgi:3-oxoacyl-[acyl-carrier-protein] synthase II
VAHEALDVAARRRIGVVIGSGGGGLGFTELQYARYFGGRFRQASVYTIPTSTTGTLSSEISMAFGFHGPSHVISTGCTSSTDAIYYAAVQVAAGMADMVVTGGVDATIAPGILAGFELMRVLTGSWNSEPERASRPFSGDRDGFVLGEGAWIYVVEPASRARERGAPVYAEVAGYASTCDAHHRVRPDESGTEPARAMTLALARAGLAGGAPDYISLHGTSTVLNDRIETRAVRQALGPRAVSTPLSAPKSIFGHPQGAAGAAGVSAALFAIAENRIPPTLNLEESDPECDLDYTPRIGRAHPVEVALANCIGFGSKNSALVLRRAGSS